MDVTLMEMLEARERRSLRQQALLRQFGRTLVCFTMNIAGPVKNSPEIREGYLLGKALLTGQLRAAGIRVLHWEEVCAVTGNEAILVVDADALTVKTLTTELEDSTPMGRLFDMDVLRPEGTKVDRQELGLPGRTCLICGGMAQGCARSRAHSVTQLQEKTGQLISDAVDAYDRETAARLTCQALLFEVAATPKPGLVDRDNNGSHKDMDYFSFQSSAAALYPYFAQCTRIGRDSRSLSPEETFSRLRVPGKLAEGTMLHATGGVNTHKGAIFSLGIVCGALGRLRRRDWADPERVLAECAAMTRGIVSRDYAGLTEETAKTAGQKLFLRHGITGVRGQAEAGFPAVRNVGLPKLEEGLSLGNSINDAACAALLAMLAATEDTNLIHRGSYELQQQTAAEIAALLESEPFPSRETLADLNRRFVEKNLSPGGTADLLAMTLLLHFLKEEAYE